MVAWQNMLQINFYVKIQGPHHIQAPKRVLQMCEI